MNKVHYKMFKAGKKWMIAGITTVAISTGAFMVNSIDANADVVSNASAYIGTPYQYGGNSRSGIDCSALVQNAYAADGINLPRTSGEQYRVTTQESAADAQYGDLVFFGSYGSDHVGIYSGNGNMINAETVDGVTSRRISVMENILGTASYRRVNGATQAAAEAQETAQPAAPVQKETAQPAAPVQKETAQPAAPVQKETAQPAAPVQKETAQPAAPVQKETAQPAAPVQKETAQPAAPVQKETAQPADVNNNRNNNITSVEPEKTDVKPVDNQVVKVVTPTNQKDTLPATGETKNSLLTVIGLGLISFVTLLGFKIRKNN
ncbi:NlpC/P60 family protein [Fructilactobacillus sanfranciscensis]|uniref:NlpC/P60 family protein n=1 Tax=Fructilactobacillus sanfranciscensis TaxID=1625 RepID=UPI000CD3F759|nr:NlpC/P60 family protein [Fructilactobacillus sanfranciscensis]POH22946.1 hypothetical protein BHU32_01410 [Fructilactobacillus sanfranciscensis DSM 20451]QFX93827.1 LPXTG cell wall anchor domain-containing protein [Fructilactobacillus sanfranciscensis]RDX59543.1 LPXTG cell wall anchor domain-containing protein [Fructilactobacillus sanfranciscensis]